MSEKITTYHQRIVLKILSVTEAFAKAGTKIPQPVLSLLNKVIDSGERVAGWTLYSPPQIPIPAPPQIVVPPQAETIKFKTSSDGYLSFSAEDIKNGSFIEGRGVYAIYNTKDFKRYIGQTKSLSFRWTTHLTDLENNRHFNKHLQSAWNLHHSSSFLFQFLEGSSSDTELGALEDKWAKKYDVFNKGYNKKETGAHETAPVAGSKGIFPSSRA